MTVLLETTRQWACPNCKVTSVTNEAKPHSRMHPCAGLGGLIAPMVPAGTKVKVTAHEREDYINGEQVQLSPEGRPVMSVVTERADGSNDVMVFAPSATASGEAPD